MKSLLKIIQEKLVINKHSKVKNYNLSFDEFINDIHNKLLTVFHKNVVIPKEHLKKQFISKISKNKIFKNYKNFEYKLIKKEDLNNWRYKVLCTICNELLQDSDAYKSMKGLILITGGLGVQFYIHVNFALDGGDDELYVLYIDSIHKTYDIYEIIR